MVPPLFVSDSADYATLLAPLRVCARARRFWRRRRNGSCPVKTAFATPPEDSEDNDEGAHDTAHHRADNDAWTFAVVPRNDVGGWSVCLFFGQR